MLKIIGLKKTFGDNEVLKGIDLEVNKGEIVVIVGPSGGGKTTLVRAINGLETCEEGKIVINKNTFCENGRYACKEVLKEISKHINDDGILFVCGFGHKHKVDSKIRQEDLILESDFEEIKNMFDLIKYEENEDERGFFVTYIFKKVLVY